MAVDPWGGYNDSVNNLNNTLVNVQNRNRQSALDDLNAQTARQSLAMGNIQLEDAQRRQADTADLRSQLAGVQPQTTTTITPAKANSGTAAQMLGVGVAPGAQYLTPHAAPTTAPTTGLEGDMQQAGLAEAPTTAPDASGFNLPQESASPTVQAYNEGRVQTNTKTEAQQKMEILTQHAIKTGDYDQITKAINLDSIMAKHKAELESGGGDLTAYVKGQMDLTAGKDLIGTIGPLMLKGDAGRQLAARYLAAAQAANPNNQMLKDAKLDDFTISNGSPVQRVYDPQTGQLLGHNILDPTKGTMEFKQSNTAELAHQTHTVKSADGKTAQDFQYNPATQAFDKPIGPAYAVASQVPSVHVAGSQMVARETMQGVTTGGKPVYKDSHGGEPFVYVDGKQVPYRGAIVPKAEGINLDPEAAPAAATIADKKANSAALRKNTERLTTLTTFTNRIDNTLPILEEVATKYGQNLRPMLNNLRSGAINKIGSPEAVADMKKLDLALIAVRGELGKVETGNIGSSGVDVSTANEWRKTLNGDMDAATILKLTPFIRMLSNTSKTSVSQVNDDIRARMSGKTQPSNGIKTAADLAKSLGL
jgi:hypothetical protein